MISQAKLVKGEIIAGRSVWSDAARLLDFLVVDHGETALPGAATTRQAASRKTGGEDARGAAL